MILVNLRPAFLNDRPQLGRQRLRVIHASSRSICRGKFPLNISSSLTFGRLVLNLKRPSGNGSEPGRCNLGIGTDARCSQRWRELLLVH